MPDKLPRHIKLQSLELDARGHRQGEIADTLGISVSSITKAKKNQVLYGDIEGGQLKRGPKKKMDPGLEDIFLSYS
jgi:hypothetical protein